MVIRTILSNLTVFAFAGVAGAVVLAAAAANRVTLFARRTAVVAAKAAAQ